MHFKSARKIQNEILSSIFIDLWWLPIQTYDSSWHNIRTYRIVDWAKCHSRFEAGAFLLADIWLKSMIRGKSTNFSWWRCLSSNFYKRYELNLHTPQWSTVAKHHTVTPTYPPVIKSDRTFIETFIPIVP